MEEYTVNYYPVAADDIKDIYSYLLENDVGEDIAKKQINIILDTLETLTIFPERYARVDTAKWKNAGMHKMPIRSYIAFYTVDKLNHIVNVVRVFVHGRNIDYLLESNQILVSEAI